ncbi:MAG: YihA family ribosome biogenesis GTP-binding protein [Crocinitomicaceae bacterium]|nr:YihA family ribosome biogenesis GTP-binding protein [Crocinitomicaceae bacterium]|tara:strand:+ start:12604 stop:13200 length:597 start_codon:yes stop_codon:yes gene_type:complete
MEIKNAEFICSNTEWEKCPKPDKPEYAFIGRSNVGKSSLINSITNHKSLAKTSGKPGKTQLINHFLINHDFFFADLPGYGYAKVSKKDREKFKDFSMKYLQLRPNLMCLFLLIDSRHSPQKIDLDFMEYCSTKEIPFVVCFTKTDKLKPKELEKNIRIYEETLLKNWEETPMHFITSSIEKTGTKELLSFIDQTNQLF